MKPLSRDTSPETQELIFRMLGSASTSKKIALTFDLIQTTRLLVLAGLRRRFPNADEVELRRQLISKLLEREDVIRAYGFDPDAQVP
jgi:hypothetical protein